jgi:hypothetical protein
MKPNPKNQHWVPQFYLREFAIPETRGDGKEQVWIFSRRHSDNLETKRVSTRNVAAQNFLYSPLRKDGSRSFAGEQMLADVDGFLSQFWPRIANGLIDFDANQGIRRGLAWFMALLLARHPDQIEVAAKIQEEMLRLYESVPKDEQGRPKIASIEIEETTHDFDNSDWAAYRDATHADIQQNVADNIRPLTIELTEHLLNKKWAIVVAPHPVFVTSDRPVYFLNSERKRFGIRTPGTRIIFPISPTRVLLAHDDERGKANSYVHLRRGDVIPWNFLTWVHAKQFLISHFEPSLLLAEMVRESDKFKRIQENARRPKAAKIGRNEHCPCQSGKKYKHCCGNERSWFGQRCCPISW